MASVTKPVLLNETGEQIVEAINKVAEAIGGNGGGNSSGGGLPTGGEAHQMLVTNEDAETVWEERTHYKSQERISLVCDEENEFNISNEDGDVVLYHAYGGSFGPGAHNQYYIEYTDMYGDDMRAYLTKAEHGGNMTLVNDSNASSECIYVIDDIPGDSVTINGHTFTNYGIYAPSSIYVVNQGGDHESVELNEIVGVSYHQLDRNYLPDDAVLPEGGAANMMLVTDADGNAKWDERTHWKEEGLIDVLPEVTINVADFGEDASELPIMQPFSSPIVVGEEYVVTYNGAEYTTTAFELQMSAEAPPLPALGNQGAIGGEDAGEPFIILYLPDEFKEMAGGVSGMLIPMDGSAVIALKIQRDGVLYHKLDPGYLPIPTTGGAVDILPEMTIELGPGESSAEFDIIEPLAYKIEIGKQYKVTHNGAVFTCTAKEMDLSEGAGEMFTPALGNLSMIPGNESQESMEPFVFFQIPSEMYEEFGFYAVLLQTEEAHSAVIGIQSIDSVKIDNSALDMDWVAKYDNVGETIVAETIGRGINVECPGADTAFFVEGATFIAYVDNVRYDLTVVSYEGTLAAGNLGLAAAGAPGNNEPFYVTTSTNGGLLFSWGVTGDMSASHTVSSYLPGGSQKVANKKVPDAFFPDIRPFLVTVRNNVADKTFAEIQGAYNAGRIVYCRLVLADEYILYYSGIRSSAAHFFGEKKVSIGSDGTVTVT